MSALFRVTYKARKVSELNILRQEAETYDVIGIDEGQFFNDIVEFC
jgi:thymidine kinase